MVANVPILDIAPGMLILAAHDYTPPNGVLPATVVRFSGTTTVMDYLEYIYDLDNGRKLYLDPVRSPHVTIGIPAGSCTG